MGFFFFRHIFEGKIIYHLCLGMQVATKATKRRMTWNRRFSLGSGISNETFMNATIASSVGGGSMSILSITHPGLEVSEKKWSTTISDCSPSEEIWFLKKNHPFMLDIPNRIQNNMWWLKHLVFSRQKRGVNTIGIFPYVSFVWESFKNGESTFNHFLGKT